ncbi:CHASE domain-containing protein [Lysobacter sp. MMG2]|uniref:CHASE domain-containing protein n=1 Tax=Lysobacter sp. MMG2 TaxID=2801338 RepID=UPI001C233B0E|nr:CHASE domain-containing protein [Lysobacter sp. MMG2]MBU8977971.1 CHASE domain-containing protein [Lysobacter sp. MMG2]
MSPEAVREVRTPDLSELSPRRGYLLALIVLVGSLVLVFTAWRAARERELRAAEAEFISKTAEVTELLRQGMTKYELVARGGVSMFASVTRPRPSPVQWQAYVDGMDLQRRFPGMVGLGFAEFVPATRLADLQLEWREAGHGMLEVWPRGQRRDYGPILYLEPKTPANVGAIGFDMYSEPIRNQAMTRAMESGNATLSGPVHLIQDGPLRSTGLLLYLPVYRGGARPATVTNRRAEIQGWVYVPVRMDGFVRNALGAMRNENHFRVFDATDGENRLLFATSAPRDRPPPAFRHDSTFELYGRHWRVEFESPPLAVAAPRLQGLQNLLALGLFSSLLLYAIAWMLARTEAQAYRIAVRMTEDFRRSEQRFRSAMRYSAIGKALLDSEGHIVEANPALASIVGLTPEALEGRRFDGLFESDEPEMIAHGQGTTDAQGVHRATRRLHREGGEPRQAQLTYSPVPGNVGQDIAGLVQVEDVTERLRAEARVHALNRTLEARVALRTRELSQANQELEAFAYSVSHDLRAPLRAIDGFSRILIERHTTGMDETGRSYLVRVRRAAGRMGELIDALLKMSRVSRGELRLERVDLSRLAGEVIEELRVGDSRRQVEVEIQPELFVIGDAPLLRNLLGNLLGNAWKFTRDRLDARIEFGAVPTEQGLEYFVRDNGAGFSQAYVDKLFRPFQRLHHNDDFAGHGIGLASVKRIVERHGGSIRAVGEVGKGATFWFTLPREKLGE